MKKPAINLYPYQKRWLEDKSRFMIGCFARQTGKTFVTTLKIVLDCLAAEAAGRQAHWVILSRGERQAREALVKGVELHARAMGLALTTLTQDFKAGDISYKALETRFPGGSRITALPANPHTARGFSANVFLDEFAFHQDSREIWKALFPLISDGYKLAVTSTPNGKGNKFYELMTGKGDQWSRHWVDIHQAVKDGLPRNIEELKMGFADDDGWSQEFELEWLDEASAWLAYDLITSCEDPGAGDPASYKGGQCYIGNDIAVRGDLWVSIVLERVGDVLWCREISTLRRASFAAQAAELDRLIKHYNPVRLAMDQTGMGEAPVEAAKRQYGSSRVSGVIFTSSSKQELAIEAKQAFEDRRVRIPVDAALRADLHKIKKITGPTGLPRFIAERDAAGHADRAWALMLAIMAAQSVYQPYDYRPVRPHEVSPKSGSGIRGIEGIW